MPEFGFLSVVEPVFAGIWEFPNGLLEHQTMKTSSQFA